MSWPWSSSFLILKQYILVPLIFQWHTPFRTLVSKICSSISDWYLTGACPFLTAVVFQRSSTPSFRLLSGLPLFFAGCFEILWFCILSTCPNHLVGRTLQNFTISSPSNTSLSPCLFLLSRVIFLQVNIFFLSLPLNYSECVGFFHGHYPSLTSREVWVLLELYIILISYFKPRIWT